MRHSRSLTIISDKKVYKPYSCCSLRDYRCCLDFHALHVIPIARGLHMRRHTQIIIQIGGRLNVAIRICKSIRLIISIIRSCPVTYLHKLNAWFQLQSALVRLKRRATVELDKESYYRCAIKTSPTYVFLFISYASPLYSFDLSQADVAFQVIWLGVHSHFIDAQRVSQQTWKRSWYVIAPYDCWEWSSLWLKIR